MAHLRSRILEFFPEQCLLDIDKIRRSVTIYNNNDKIVQAIQTLNKYNIDFVRIGTGTNRLAILVDHYIFKFAMDDEGVRDNNNEFVMSQYEAPRVLRTYETNGLISVSEYVTLITMEQFMERSSEILEILEELSQKYLFGDIGLIKKNFQNWGYRSDGSLVILDYAYMYHIHGHMMACQNCGKPLHYDRYYSKLVCTNCSSSFTFWQIRKKIDMKRIDRFIQEELGRHLRVVAPVTEISDKVYEDHLPYDEEYGDGEGSLYTKEGRESFVMSAKKMLGMYNPEEFSFSANAYGNSPFSSYRNLTNAIKGQDNDDDENDENPMVEILEDFRSDKERKSDFADYLNDFRNGEMAPNVVGDTEEDSDEEDNEEEDLPENDENVDEVDVVEERSLAVAQAILYLQGKSRLPENLDEVATRQLKEMRTSMLSHGKKEPVVTVEAPKANVSVNVEVKATEQPGEEALTKEELEALTAPIEVESTPVEEVVKAPVKEEQRTNDSVTLRKPTEQPKRKKEGGYFNNRRGR